MLKKIMGLTLAVVMVLCCLAGCSSKKSSDDDWAYIQDKGTLVVGVTEYAPMDYKDDNGEWTGFDAEYARAVGEILGVDIEFVIIDWDNKVNELNSKAIDCVWNGMTINESVLKSMDCTDAYVVNAQVVVMPADKADQYKDAASLAGLTVAVESGSAGQDMAEENNLDFVAVAAQSDALMEVASGSADACIIDITMANAMTGEGTSYAQLTSVMSLSEEEYGIGCRKGSSLVEQINDATQQMLEEGALQALAEKYSLTLAD